MNPTERENRFQAGVPAELHYRGRDYPCVAQSLGRTGVLLVGQMPWPDEAAIEFTLRTTGGDLVVDLFGRVVHVSHSEEKGEMRLGVEFERVDDKQRRALESLVNRVAEGVAPAPLESLARGASPQQVRAALENIPVAHRINLASRAQVNERRFLYEDTNLQVLEGLARNPNTTAEEIRKLARRHNLLPSTLELMAKDRRWHNDEELKMILVTHPRATLKFAEEIAGRLSDRSLKKIVRHPGLHAGLKAKLLSRFSGRELAGW